MLLALINLLCIQTNIPKSRESQKFVIFFFSFLNSQLKKQTQLMSQCHYCNISANNSLCLSMKQQANIHQTYIKMTC